LETIKRISSEVYEWLGQHVIEVGTKKTFCKQKRGKALLPMKVVGNRRARLEKTKGKVANVGSKKKKGERVAWFVARRG